MPFCDPTHRLHAVMAGNGDPYAVLTTLRLRLLRGMQGGATAEVLARSFDLDTDRLRAELAPLIEASLVVDESGIFRPNVLIATEEETRIVDAHATVLGKRLADRLKQQWVGLERDFAVLDVSGRSTFAELAFLLVGDRILDVGLLDALAHDGTLMPAAPARPSPGRTEARYYFWLIEGDHELLGKYGQRTTSLTGDGWDLLTFGQYTFGDDVNLAREELERAASALLSEGVERTPDEMARLLGIPWIDSGDTERWGAVARRASEDLLATYLEARSSLDDLFSSLSAASTPGTSFGEFFCWFDHVAYAHAIDALNAAGLISIPESRFSSAVWRETPESAGF